MFVVQEVIAPSNPDDGMVAYYVKRETDGSTVVKENI